MPNLSLSMAKRLAKGVFSTLFDLLVVGSVSRRHSKPAGPHQTARRALSSNAAKTLDGGAAILRDARKVVAFALLATPTPSG